MTRLYDVGNRDIVELDTYEDHVHAMTGEKLHRKSDIAAELAFRDERIAELEKGYEELTIATLDAVQCMGGGKCKADLRDAYDKAVEQLKEQGE